MKISLILTFLILISVQAKLRKKQLLEDGWILMELREEEKLKPVKIYKFYIDFQNFHKFAYERCQAKYEGFKLLPYEINYLYGEFYRSPYDKHEYLVDLSDTQ